MQTGVLVFARGFTDFTFSPYIVDNTNVCANRFRCIPSDLMFQEVSCQLLAVNLSA
jgi:hypothetical protein